MEEIFARCPSISIDYGVLERADNVFVRSSDFGWNDVGTWGSLYELSAKDADGNVVPTFSKLYDTDQGGRKEGRRGGFAARLYRGRYAGCPADLPAFA